MKPEPEPARRMETEGPYDARTVTLARLWDAVHANLLAGLLDQPGTPTIISGEITGAYLPSFGRMLQQKPAGGVRVMVREEDFDDAHRILEEAEGVDAGRYLDEIDPQDMEDDLASELPACPACGSESVGPPPLNLFHGLAAGCALTLFLVSPFWGVLGILCVLVMLASRRRVRLHCNACGHFW